MKHFTLLLAALAVTLSINAQREHITQHIEKYDQCQSVAITQNNGNAMIFSTNQWVAEGCPNNFTEALYELKVEKQNLQDIHLTELGRWIILYNDNQTRSDLLYENLKQKITNCQEDGEKITTVTFNDKGDWIVVTTKQISASSDLLMSWIADGCERYGQVWTACITDDAAIIVYEGGFKYYGNIPEDLLEAMRACDKDVYTIKISGNAWLFRCTDNTGVYSL